MSEVTIEQKIMVVAKSFFDDGFGDDDYPFRDVSEQYEEMLNDLKQGRLSIDFIEAVYEMNRQKGVRG